MTRRRALLCIVLATSASATAIAACLPDYTFRTDSADSAVAEGGSDASSDGTSVDGAAEDASSDGATTDANFGDTAVFFDSSLPDAAGFPDGGPTVVMAAPPAIGFSFMIESMMVTGKLTRSFEIDRNEVTVGRFKQWVAAGSPEPCTSGKCTLDPGGPYATQMIWDADAYGLSTDTQLRNCQTGPNAYGPPSTYGLTNPNLPMTCATWYDAAAFCHFEGKRLPTEVEWVWTVTSRGTEPYYPWSGALDVDPPSCNFALFNLGLSTDAGGGCGFPRAVGSSSPAGDSKEGVQDLTGSVFEWVWDVGVYGSFPSAPPPDYAGPMTASARRIRRGGSYNSDPGDGVLRNYGRNVDFNANEPFADVGFRCARSKP